MSAAKRFTATTERFFKILKRLRAPEISGALFFLFLFRSAQQPGHFFLERFEGVAGWRSRRRRRNGRRRGGTLWRNAHTHLRWLRC